MVFNNQKIQYRITLDTEANIFIVCWKKSKNNAESAGLL